MIQKKRRDKNEPTTGDLLAQAYRNRAAMRRVFEASFFKGYYLSYTKVYWNPRNMDDWEHNE